MAYLSTLGGNRARAAPAPGGEARHRSTRAGVHVGGGTAVDPIRHLQTRAAALRSSSIDRGSGIARATDHTACVSAHRGRPFLEAGVEVNVIRGCLGHVSLETTNRYAEITMRMKEAAMRLCEPPTTDAHVRKPAWRDDPALLAWLASL